jgi:transcriptional regulator with XRE-family HTH domain
MKQPVKNITDYTFVKPEHIRAARAWLGWNLDEMQQKSGVDRDTISRFELGKKNIRNATRARLYRACYEAGVEILWNGLWVRHP